MDTAKIRKREAITEMAFFVFLFLFYVMWARVQFLNAGPDEEMRYAVAQYIYKHGKLPLGDDPEVINSAWGFSYAFYPTLSYVFSALFMKLMSFASTAPFPLLFAARMPNVLMGVGTARISLSIGRRLFNTPEKAWMFTAVISLLPGSMFVYTYVNCDGLAMLSSAVIVLAWIRGMQEGWRIKNCGLLSVGVAACALSYYNAYGFILCSIFFFGFTLLMEARERGGAKYFVLRGSFVCVLILVLCGWWFVRNAVLYDGDFLGRKALSACAEKYAQKEFTDSQLKTPQEAGYSLWEMLSQPYPDKDKGYSWAQNVTESFVGCFGQQNILMPRWMINLYLNFLKLGLLISVIHPVKTVLEKIKRHWSREAVFHWCMLAAMIIPVILNIWYSYCSDYQPQGRYSLPMMIPLTYFVVRGYEYLTDRLENTPVRKKATFLVICAAMAVLAVFVFLTVIWPAYRDVPFTISNFISAD